MHTTAPQWTDETTSAIPALGFGSSGTLSPPLRQQPGERWHWDPEVIEATKLESTFELPLPASAIQLDASKLFGGDEDVAIVRLRERVGKGDLGVLLDLISAVIAPSPEDEDGVYAALALETLAGLRSTIFERLVVSLIRMAVRSLLSDLRFSAIASAGELSREGRLEVLSVIRTLEADPDPDIRAASKAFVDSTVH